MSLTTVNVDVRDDWIGTRNTELDGLMIRGDELTLRGCESPSGLIKQSAKGGCEPFFLPSVVPLFLWRASYIIWFFLDHPGPTLVSHPCLYLSAHHISHSFWRSVSYGDPDWTVQGSCPHKCGQDISCGHLMQRWQFLLELLLHHTLMADSLHLCFPLEHSGRLPLAMCYFFLPWSWFAEDRIVQHLAIWTFFVRPRTFLPPQRGSWAWYEMGQDCQIFWPHSNQTW